MDNLSFVVNETITTDHLTKSVFSVNTIEEFQEIIPTIIENCKASVHNEFVWLLGFNIAMTGLLYLTLKYKWVDEKFHYWIIYIQLIANAVILFTL